MEEIMETMVMTVEELKQRGREAYAKMVQAYNDKDWLNFSVLADQVKFIKEDLAKYEQDTKAEELER